MRYFLSTIMKVIVFQLLLMGFFISKTTAAEISLTNWPEGAAAKLTSLIERHANQGHFAVFDMDNTSYRYDITESLLPYLENLGILTRDTLDPSLKLIPFKDEKGVEESLFSYYNRLCVVIDDRVCYPWIAQAFSGLTLGELKTHVDAMLAAGAPIPVSYWNGDELVQAEVKSPVLFTGQSQLFKALMDNGIEVYIITAGNEEIIRMIASDPKYGYNVKPENVIGVTTLLKNRVTGELTNSDLMIAQGSYDQEANLDLEVTPYMWSPATWMEGKSAVILNRIDRWRRPILAAGDTPSSDGYMLMNSLDPDGIKLWINRSDRHMKTMLELMKEGAQAQQGLGLPVTANKNWVIVTPDDIL